MTHTQYGELIDLGVNMEGGGTEGFLSLKGAIGFLSAATMPTAFTVDKDEVTAIANKTGSDVLVLQLSGRVFGSQETMGACYVIPWMDVGMLAGLFIKAAQRAPGGHAAQDFMIGMNNEIGTEDDDRDTSGSGE